MILLIAGLVWADGIHSILWKTDGSPTDFISLQFRILQSNDSTNFNLISTLGRRLQVGAFVNRGFIFLSCMMNLSQIPMQLQNFIYHDEAIHSYQNKTLTYIFPQAFQFNRTYKLALIRSETSSPAEKNISLYSFSQSQGWTFHLSMDVKQLQLVPNDFGVQIQSSMFNTLKIQNQTSYQIDLSNLVVINNKYKVLNELKAVQIRSGVPSHYPIQYLNKDGVLTMRYGGELLSQLMKPFQELAPVSKQLRSEFKVRFNQISYSNNEYQISWQLLQGSSPQLVITAQHGGKIIFWQINQALRSISGKKQGGKGLITLTLSDLFGQKVQKKFD